MTAIAHARRLADATPASRNRYVDFLRAISIMAVVVGHWLAAAPYIHGGQIEGINLLAHTPWTQWLTWAFQVMPVFFMVGGYSNATSYASAQRKGQDYGTWLGARLRRLLLPIAPLVAVWAVLGMVLSSFGMDADLLRMGSQTALIPVWFLAVYIVIVAATPVLVAGWDRWGWGSIAAMAAGALTVDLLAANIEWIGWANFGFVWIGVAQLGTAWQRGRIGGRAAVPLALLAGAAVAVLVTVGPYPISMVGVPGAVRTNNSPPTLALLTFGLAQTSALLAFEAPARRMLDRARVWTATVFVNGLIMTLYLWHLTAMVLLIGASMLAGGFGFGLEPGSGIWWATRPLWMLAAAVATFPFLVVFRRFDSVEPMEAGVRIDRRVALGIMVTACLGLALLASTGIGGSFFGIRLEVVALPLVAVWALRRIGSKDAVSTRS